MAVLEFIINNILTQAAVVIGLVACLGLVLQKKSANDVLLGTFKTMLGFLVLAAGSSVMQGSLAYFGDMFNSAFGFNGMTAVVASIEGINGQAMTDLGLGSEIAICLAGIFVVNIILARFTKFNVCVPDWPGPSVGVHALRRVRLLLRSARYPPDRRQLHRRWRLRYPHACLRSARCPQDHRVR